MHGTKSLVLPLSLFSILLFFFFSLTFFHSFSDLSLPPDDKKSLRRPPSRAWHSQDAQRRSQAKVDHSPLARSRSSSPSTRWRLLASFSASF
ncbi:uncharacterized protein K460DRAFT_371794 [Cucurbitaria berberidis CBS 394.84]|uniref:Uncharacterized protein n=1 Tax=Cucurbitaria berberidis CBS 394.84 TaxID=1168544 RepID=A0A9P4G7Q3_9PLEO|nr:uncharacterized protein K460DRAFT_371794 [Cucurbitaria berberidis CBS 394.84]KAF1840588.1 hypothetical protein K460DRAFT_371794 [Cucurbitaria berberidis CBS 394.84]